MKTAVLIVVFAAGAHVGALVALFAAHRLDGPRPRFAAVRGFGRASAPSHASPVSEPIVPPVLLTLPKPLVVSDVQVLPGRSGWGRPSWPRLNLQFAQPLGWDDPEPVPDDQRTVEPDDDEHPHELHATPAPALTGRAASIVRRLARTFRAPRHEGWEHGHMHELRGTHRSDAVAEPTPGHRPAHSVDGETRRGAA